MVEDDMIKHTSDCWWKHPPTFIHFKLYEVCWIAWCC